MQSEIVDFLLFSSHQCLFIACSNPGHPFCSGVTLATLAAVTIDETGHETFVTSGALERLRKVRIPHLRSFDLFKEIGMHVRVSLLIQTQVIVFGFLCLCQFSDPCIVRIMSGFFSHVVVLRVNSLFLLLCYIWMFSNSFVGPGKQRFLCFI